MSPEELKPGMHVAFIGTSFSAEVELVRPSERNPTVYWLVKFESGIHSMEEIARLIPLEEYRFVQNLKGVS